MKRSVLVVAGTAVGVTAVVSYHATTPSTATGLAGDASAQTTTRKSSAASGSSSASASASASHSSTTRRSTTTTGATSSHATSSRVRSAVGEAVGFQYGDVEVKVTEHGGRITDVSIVRFAVADPHSESIDAYAVPRLRRQVLAAQSAHIDGVSGASYTSQAYAQSVQSALDKLA